jgi:hypothetical protein
MGNINLNRWNKLAGIDEDKSPKYPSEIINLINKLINVMGYKRYELSFNRINTLAGRYVIELPTTGFSVPQLKELISILGPDMVVQYSPYTSHSGMIIKTGIKVQ